MATTVRIIAADPTSTALLVAALTGVVPERSDASSPYVAIVRIGSRSALLRLAPLAGVTRASLSSRRTWRGRAAAEFLATLGGAAEARADAA